MIDVQGMIFRWRVSSKTPILRSGAVAALLIAVFIGAAFAGYQHVFSTLAIYDDEGYVMLSLRSFLQGYPLYDDTYTQYGPAYYIFQAAVHRIADLPITHDVTRQKTLVVWLAVALLGMGFAYRTTQSLPLSVVAFVAVFFHFDRFTQEPGHPQEICALLIGGMLLLGTYMDNDPRRGWLVFMLAALVGTATLIKINVGGLLLLAVVLTMLIAGGRSHRWTIQLWLGITVALLLPIVLAFRHPPASTTLILPTVTLLALIGIILVALRLRPPPMITYPHFLFFVGMFVMVSVAWLIATWWNGTSFGGLVYGILLQHMRFGDAFFEPPLLSLWGMPCALLSLVLLYFALRGSDRLVFVPQLVLASVLVMVSVAHLYETSVVLKSGMQDRGLAGMLVSFAPSLLWAILIPRRPAISAVRHLFLARLLLCMVAALGPLLSYPIAGTQMALGSFPLLLTVVVAVGDLVRRQPGPIRWNFGTRGMVVGGLVALSCMTIVYRDVSLWHRRSKYTPLNLPGAAQLRLVVGQVVFLQRWTSTLQDCDTFVFAENTVSSFYFWTGIDPPTALNATVWRYQLRAAEQARIVEALKRYDRVLVVHETGPWPHYKGQSQLMDYLITHFKSHRRHGPFELWKKKGRSLSSAQHDADR